MDYNPLRDGLTADMHRELRVLLAEIMGLAEGCSGGRGGSMHLVHRAAGVIGTNAIVAGGVPHATGVAWAEKCQNRDTLTVCFFGDGAMYQGVLDESSNLAALWQAPIVYFIENNQVLGWHRLESIVFSKKFVRKGAGLRDAGAARGRDEPLGGEASA